MTKIPFEEVVEELIKNMTLEEKVSQLVHDSKAIERLGIKKYNWWNECLHGVARAGIATVFPQTIGIAASWNKKLIHSIGIAISDEARAKHHDFDRNGKNEIYQGLTYWSPNINIFRDPRWGRGMETFGEDPFLTSVLAVSFIKGLQGDDENYFKLIATPKHFAVHSGPESERHTFDAHPSVRDLWETYLPAFEACIREGKAYSIMGAYNRLFGEACTASKLLLIDILRDRWGFQGYVVSDAGAITDISEHHHIVPTIGEAAALAVKNGTDLCAGTEYLELVDAHKFGFITEDEIDVALKRLLLAKAKLGLLEGLPKHSYSSIPLSKVDCEEHRELALTAAKESLVLLKNKNQTLPIKDQYRSIAVIGPNANEKDIHLGNYHGTPTFITSLFEGVKQRAGSDIKVNFERGCQLANGLPFLDVLDSNNVFLNQDCLMPGLSATYYSGKNSKKEVSYREVFDCLNHKIFENLHKKVPDINDFCIVVTGYLKPIISGSYALGVAGLTSFKLLVDEVLLTEFDTIWEPEKVYQNIDLQSDKVYKIELHINASTSEAHVQKLLWAVPDEDMETRALSLAQQSDLIVLALGLSPQLEGEEMPVIVPGFDKGDRSDIALPDVQEQLMKKIVALNKPTVLVNFSGCCIALNWAEENIPSIIQAWYGGQAAGSALASVLFGDYNPSGRLPITFYKSISQLPAFNNYAMEGRTYRYLQQEPLYHFGHGLSYSAFAYSQLEIIKDDDLPYHVNVSLRVQNISELAGEDLIQLYIRRKNPTEKYPIVSLQGFEKVFLKAKESCIVNFQLTAKNFEIIQEDLTKAVEPGMFELLVGGGFPKQENMDAKKVLVASIEL